jgi:antitoxin PrlF
MVELRIFRHPDMICGAFILWIIQVYQYILISQKDLNHWQSMPCRGVRMTKPKAHKSPRQRQISETGCCKVESVVGIDYRGQLVLPKELRDRAKVKAGDKMAVVSWQKGGEVCCIVMIKADGLTKLVTDMLGPIMKDMTER